MGKFQIDCHDLYWFSVPGHEQEDLCLHGFVTAIIGEETIQEEGTVSSTALYLLKTLSRNHITGEENQMIPCCGHTLLPNDDLTEVNIIGCPNGIDWTVEHVQQGVKITTNRGSVTFVPMNVYREEIFRFADKIEDYYKRCEPKTPADDLDKRGYAVFWNEWHRRRHS